MKTTEGEGRAWMGGGGGVYSVQINASSQKPPPVPLL